MLVNLDKFFTYCYKINELEAELNKERSRSSLSTNTLDETKSKIQALTSRISELESVNLGLQQKLSEYSQKLDDDRFTHRSQVVITSHNNFEIYFMSFRLVPRTERLVSSWMSCVVTRTSTRT